MSDVIVTLTPPPIIAATVNPDEIAVSVTAAPAVAVTVGPVAGSHNGLAGIQGGALNDYYHLTAAKYNVLGLHESLTDLLGGLAAEHYHLNAAEYSVRGLHNSLTDLQGGQAGQYYHLTAADYAAKILGTGTLGYIPYFTGAQGIGNSNIFYNVVNGRVGIGSIVPAYKLDVAGTGLTDKISTDIGLNLRQVTKPIAPVLTQSQNVGLVDVGVHYYFVTYITELGETNQGEGASITVVAPNNTVIVTIPISTDPRVTGRKIYRTKAGGAIYFDYFLVNIPNNVDVIYTDLIADTALTGDVRASQIRPNTTNKMITVSGVTAMILDAYDTVFGISAGASLTTGGRNTFLGCFAGNKVTSGLSNVFVGELAGSKLTSGSQNIAIGYTAMSTAITSVGNNAMGYLALAACVGDYNVAIGNLAGNILTSGSYNTFIGANQTASAITVQNETIIGYNAVGAGPNTVRLGNTSITGVYTSGKYFGNGNNTQGIADHADNATAVAAGLSVGDFYKTGDLLKIVHA